MTREPAALIWPEAELRQALRFDPFQAPPRTPLRTDFPAPEWDEAVAKVEPPEPEPVDEVAAQRRYDDWVERTYR